MLIDGIKIPVSASITDTVTSASDRVTSLPGTVTENRVIELTQQDGANNPGIYKGVADAWVLQDDTLDEKILSIETSVDTLSTTVTSVTFYDIAGNTIGIPEESVSVLRMVTPRTFTIPATFTGSRAVCATASTASAVFTIKKWNTSHTSSTTLGTITFAAGQKIGTFSQNGAGDMIISTGETLELVAPTTADSTLADIAYVISSQI